MRGVPRKVQIGQRFGRLTVIAPPRSTKKNRGRMVRCRCDCGAEVEVAVRQLGRVTRGTRSCGCLAREVRAEMGRRQAIHGQSREGAWTPAYRTWHAMIQRATDVNHPRSKHYAARGVSVCERWAEPRGRGFLNFLEDMGERPEGRTIDRIDPDGNYEPENCRWATVSEQNRNKRRGAAVKGASTIGA